MFVAGLGCSQLLFAWAAEDMKSRNWLDCHQRLYTFYGGVPQLIVPDNPRALVSDACRYEPKLNETVRDFALREVEPGVRLIMNTSHITDDHDWKPRPATKDEN